MEAQEIIATWLNWAMTLFMEGIWNLAVLPYSLSSRWRVVNLRTHDE